MPACRPACQPAPLSLSHLPSLFPDKKFPVEAHLWLDKLFYYIDSSVFLYKFMNDKNMFYKQQY